MSPLVWGALGLSAIWLWIALYQPRFAIDVVSIISERVIYRVKTRERAVALSLDDGPSELTEDIVGVLRANSAHATFFLLGGKAAVFEHEIGLIRDGGHEIGNHMMTSVPSFWRSKAGFKVDLKEAEQALRIDGPLQLCRPASGWIRPDQVKALEEEGYVCCLGSVYPNDTKHHSVGLSRAFILRKIRAGDIIVLHEGSKKRRYVLEILRTLLPELRRRGYAVVSVGDLLRMSCEEDGC